MREGEGGRNRGREGPSKGGSTDSVPTTLPQQHTIGNSRITFHHFIFRELFLVIISSWLTSKKSGRIISRNLSDLHLWPHLPQHT